MVNKSIVITAPKQEENAAALLVQQASAFSSRIHLTWQNRTVNAKSIMGMMTLPLSEGDAILISADGADEELAANRIEAFLTN